MENSYGSLYIIFQCQFRTNLDLFIADLLFLLQLDGYESYLNAIDEIDVNGQINEGVSPGDCTDLSSTIDQEIGSFIKK